MGFCAKMPRRVSPIVTLKTYRSIEMRKSLTLVSMLLVFFCSIALAQESTKSAVKKPATPRVKSSTPRTQCEGGFTYGQSETQTIYLGTNPKRYRLSIWLYPHGHWTPDADLSTRDNSALLAINGGPANVKVPNAPASIDVEATRMDVTFGPPPTTNPIQAICFEPLP